MGDDELSINKDKYIVAWLDMYTIIKGGGSTFGSFTNWPYQFSLLCQRPRYIRLPIGLYQQFTTLSITALLTAQ